MRLAAAEFSEAFKDGVETPYVLEDGTPVRVHVVLVAYIGIVF